MKYRSLASKTSRQTKTNDYQESSAGQNEISIAPPIYGIDFVDRKPADAGPLSVNPPSVIQAKPMTAPPGEGSDTPGVGKKNKTGLPDRLKTGIESLSGLSMDDVSVHYNSAKPAQLQALAYTQGPDIHVGPGQARHLPHEAWHVVQQKQGRVKSTMQANGVAINDDKSLEKEADRMGSRANAVQRQKVQVNRNKDKEAGGEVVQRVATLVGGTAAEGGIAAMRNGGAFYVYSAVNGTALTSDSFGSCVGMVLHDQANDRGLVAHFWMPAAVADANTIRLWWEAQGNTPGNTDATVFGGTTYKSKSGLDKRFTTPRVDGIHTLLATNNYNVVKGAKAYKSVSLTVGAASQPTLTAGKSDM